MSYGHKGGGGGLGMYLPGVTGVVQVQAAPDMDPEATRRQVTLLHRCPSTINLDLLT